MSDKDWWAKKLGTTPQQQPPPLAPPPQQLQPVQPPQQPVHVEQVTHVYDPKNPPRPGEPGSLSHALATGQTNSTKTLRQGICPSCQGSSYFARGKAKPVCFECGYPLEQAVGVEEG